MSGLNSCHVDMTYVEFANLNNSSYKLQNLTDNSRILDHLILQNFHFMYVDESKEMGLATNTTRGMQLKPMAQGNLWLHLDPYQGCAAQDEHALERGFRKTIQWWGEQLDQKKLSQGVQGEQVHQAGQILPNAGQDLPPHQRESHPAH